MCEFLDIGAQHPLEFTPRFVAGYDGIDADTRAGLREYFRPHNERLYELIGQDLGWR